MNEISLTNFIDLDEEKKFEILSWRNNNNIRVWMYDNSVIEKETHLSFINSLKNDQARQYFLVKKANEDIGIIYFTDISNDSAEFGIYAKPSVKGVGKVLMQIICDYSFSSLNLKELYAEVFEDNEKAIALYNRFNFRQIDRKVKNNRTILVMELKNENR